MQIKFLDPINPDEAFPALEEALTDPNGLLAFGGCLSPQRLFNAYRRGIFPWFNPGEPILWWSPNPRLVLFPDKLTISRSLTKTLRKQNFEIRYDSAFPEVMQACAAPRHEQSATWISQDMQTAFHELFLCGIAHSFEAWQDDKLVGGLYGVAIGQVFFGESMFHRQTDASKVAFVEMVRQISAWGYEMIDCQVHTGHLLSLGAEEISREIFRLKLEKWCELEPTPQAWLK
jgi:leucyl/phenylalanyl-tRNA--protein transferase